MCQMKFEAHSYTHWPFEPHGFCWYTFLHGLKMSILKIFRCGVGGFAIWWGGPTLTTNAKRKSEQQISNPYHLYST